MRVKLKKDIKFSDGGIKQLLAKEGSLWDLTSAHNLPPPEDGTRLYWGVPAGANLEDQDELYMWLVATEGIGCLIILPNDAEPV
jgi:hypothetical protein